jgi:hypothetical protein
MTFRETLDRHLQSIQERDLSTLIDTLPADKLILIMADGRLVRDFTIGDNPVVVPFSS